jgi:rod shape-determining protein MreC
LVLADHRFHNLETVRAGLSIAVYPLQWVVNLPVTTGQWLTETLASRQKLLEENASLRAQHLLLKAQMERFSALEAENMRLRELLDSSFQFRIGERLLIAELSAVATDPFSQQVVINKGARDKVFVGQPVLDAEGVMGQVLHVAPLSSTVMLITDPNHALPVQVNRNGLRSIAVGTGRANQLELAYLPNNADIRVGDQLVTSGLGGRFPYGYPVGTVIRVEQDPRQPFAKVIAQPNARLDRNREVLLVWASSQGATPEDGIEPTEAPAP